MWVSRPPMDVRLCAGACFYTSDMLLVTGSIMESIAAKWVPCMHENKMCITFQRSYQSEYNVSIMLGYMLKAIQPDVGVLHMVSGWENRPE
jgi:hypothetical protein